MMPELLVAIPVDVDDAARLNDGYCPECPSAEADVIEVRKGWICCNCGTRYIQQERRTKP